MAKERGNKNSHKKYVLPLFIVASSLVFAVLFVILLMPTIVTKFGFETIFILLLAVTGTTASILAILFYLLLKKDIKF